MPRIDRQPSRASRRRADEQVADAHGEAGLACRWSRSRSRPPPRRSPLRGVAQGERLEPHREEEERDRAEDQLSINVLSTGLLHHWFYQIPTRSPVAPLADGLRRRARAAVRRGCRRSASPPATASPSSSRSPGSVGLRASAIAVVALDPADERVERQPVGDVARAGDDQLPLSHSPRRRPRRRCRSRRPSRRRRHGRPRAASSPPRCAQRRAASTPIVARVSSTALTSSAPRLRPRALEQVQQQLPARRSRASRGRGWRRPG